MEMVSEMLNAKQKEAVEATDGPVLVVAGAGAGKTKVITERIKYLISQEGVAPENILAVTFTNKAAGEMRERVLKHETRNTKPVLHASSYVLHDLPFIGTFHALGVLIIKENLKKLGVGKNFTILDEDDSLKIVKTCLEELRIDPKQFDPARIRGQISSLKNQMITPEIFDEESYFGKILGDSWKRYEEKLKIQNLLDFDDLLLKPVFLFEKNKDILAYYQNRWKYIHVDEYQDTNEVQYRLTQHLAASHRNIFVVGDIDQAIYSWRGADFKNVLNFQKDYPDAKIVTLEENYRSTNIILEAANTLILNNKMRLPKNLWTKNSGKNSIKIISAEDERMEAELVAKELLGLLRQKALRSLKDAAVLYRTNAQSRALEEVFISRNIPYKIIGGVRFYERKEIKDLLAYLRYVLNPSDEISKKRILNTPPRGIGKTLSLKILGGISDLKPEEEKKKEEFDNLINALKKEAEDKNAHEFLKILIHKIGFKPYINDGTEKGLERWQNVEELLGIAKKISAGGEEGSLEKFLEHVSLFAIDDFHNPNDPPAGGRVSLMTMHSAKGLEFEAVFVVGMEEGLFPHMLSYEPASLEEERRLCYVALTRARTHLYLSHASRRGLFGDHSANMPSRFLRELPEHLLHRSEYSELNRSNSDEEIIIE